MRTQNQKLKLLYLMDILLNETDEQHILTVEMLIEKLEIRGINAERKAIYRDLEVLIEYGIDVIRVRNKGVFVGARQFDLPELKLLADAVASSKFITPKKSEQLIRKLQSLTSKNQAQTLTRQIYFLNQDKAENEQIFYNIDTIHQAIELNRQISFVYYAYGQDKKLQPKRNGERYVVSPKLLIWDDRNYYLIAYYARYSGLSHFRLDKMQMIYILDQENDGRAQELNPASYANQTFSMFGGKVQKVELSFDPTLIGVFIDRFGKDIMISKSGDWLKTMLKVNVSVTFYGWLLQMGSQVKLNAPKQVVDGFIDYLDDVRKQYD